MIIVAGSVIGFAAAVLLSAAVVVRTRDVAPAASAARPALYQTPVTHTIYTAQEALDRTVQEFWPEYLQPTGQVVRLMTYGEFSDWYSGEYPVTYEGKHEPAWVVAITANGATPGGFIGDGDELAPVDGFMWQWEV